MDNITKARLEGIYGDIVWNLLNIENDMSLGPVEAVEVNIISKLNELLRLSESNPELQYIASHVEDAVMNFDIAKIKHILDELEVLGIGE